MSVAKILELSSDSETSFDDALKKGIARAAKTVEHVRGVWVKDQEVQVENGEIKTYRLHLKVTFTLKD